MTPDVHERILLHNGVYADTMADMIREAIIREVKRRKLTGYRLEKLTGINSRSIERYLGGEMDLASVRLDKLCKVLGLRLTRTRKGG